MPLNNRSLALAAIFAAITQLGASGAALADDAVTISYLTHWPPETVAKLNDAISRYSKDHPSVKIQVHAVPFGDLLTTIRSQAGGANAPTIAGIYDLWLPELVRDHIVAEAPADVSADVGKEWPGSAASASSVAAKVFGYPNEIDLYALNYNKKLFAAAGIAAPPKTWDEFTADAKKLSKQDGGRVTQQGFGFINSWAAGVVHPFASLLASNGGSLIVDGKAALDTKQAKETFALVQKLIEDKSSDAAMGTADANTTGPFLDNFVGGKTAMIIMANWWESALHTGMGDAGFADIATAPIPVGPSGDASHAISYTWLNVVSASASDAQKKAAWEFLAWLDGPTSGGNGASAMGDILQSMGILPSRKTDVGAFAQRLSTPFLAGYVGQLQNARPFPAVLGGQEFTESLQHHLEAVQFGKETADAASEAAQKDAAAILSKAAAH